MNYPEKSWLETIDLSPLAQMEFFITILLPICFSLCILEGVVLRLFVRSHFNWNELATSLIMKTWQTLYPLLVPHAINLTIIQIAWLFIPSNIYLFKEIPKTISTLIILLFLQEFFYYWGHRASHNIRWFWASHIVHHSTTQINWSAGFRDSWLSLHTGASVFYIPLIIIGFPPNLVLAASSINITYQFWIHNSWMPKLGPLEYILNTPSLHRVHHARNPEYINANFGGILIVFDIIFGTYKAEKKSLPCDYGLSKQMNSHNPFYIELREWSYIFHDLKKIKKPVDLIKTLLFIPK